jgi:hypothetical protein
MNEILAKEPACGLERSMARFLASFSRRSFSGGGMVQSLLSITSVAKFERSREFVPGYKVDGGHRRSVAVQIISEPEICQGAGF